MAMSELNLYGCIAGTIILMRPRPFSLYSSEDLPTICDENQAVLLRTSPPFLMRAGIAGDRLLPELPVLPKAAFGQYSAHGFTISLAASELMLNQLCGNKPGVLGIPTGISTGWPCLSGCPK